MHRPSVQIFGIRHHGPGSARSLLGALDSMGPDCVLVEGPPEGEAVIELLGHPKMKPPVAMVVYAEGDPNDAVYYPFAEFSPEYQAVRYALRKKVTLRLMDLPQGYQLGKRGGEEGGGEEPYEAGKSELRRDPLKALAEAAGYSDSERWWEHMVEQRADARDLFDAILEAMTALRSEVPEATEEEDLLREAHMRRVIRGAVKEGHEKIAVVCGAWHGPALVDLSDGKKDEEKLKGLAKTKVVATWVPWMYSRLASRSGYGAGVRSPGWYEYVWEGGFRGRGPGSRSQQADAGRLTVGWMTKVARLLREEDLDASSGSVIEAVRLAEALASLRGRPVPGLSEMTEAAQAVLGGSDVPMRVVQEKLIVGQKVGEVPEETPMVPLQRDLVQLQKRLRLRPETSQKTLELDLRNETDLQRSLLLHRLSLMGVGWGQLEGTSGKGTFKEAWRVQWRPELAVGVIEASRWGNTVLDAATAYTRDAAEKAGDLPTITALLGRVLFADLPGAVKRVMERLSSEAAVASDLGKLMDALPPLAQTVRYGSVRQMDVSMLGKVIEGVVTRACVGLPAAASSLNDEAAEAMFKRVQATHGAVSLVNDRDHVEMWQGALARLSESQTVHGLVAGRATRILTDAQAVSSEVVEARMSLALSAGNDSSRAAAWVEGFLKNSGLLLLHDPGLWGVLDRWVDGLSQEAFTRTLPLLRRTFATFEAGERRQMQERARRREVMGKGSADDRVDPARADAVLPLVAKLLGIE